LLFCCRTGSVRPQGCPRFARFGRSEPPRLPRDF
jgi:hypothetical protein